MTVKTHAVGNEIPAFADRGDARLPLRGVASLLGRGLEQAPDRVHGHGSPRQSVVGGHSLHAHRPAQADFARNVWQPGPLSAIKAVNRKTPPDPGPVAAAWVGITWRGCGSCDRHPAVWSRRRASPSSFSPYRSRNHVLNEPASRWLSGAGRVTRHRGA
jgi:hypothetical protein